MLLMYYMEDKFIDLQLSQKENEFDKSELL